MVPMDLGSFLDLGISLDRIVLAAVIGVLVLAVYEASTLIAAMLATRSGKQPARPAPHANLTRPGGS